MTTALFAGQEYRDLVALLSAAPFGWIQIDRRNDRHAEAPFTLHAPKSDPATAHGLHGLCGRPLSGATAITRDGMKLGRVCGNCSASLRGLPALVRETRRQRATTEEGATA